MSASTNSSATGGYILDRPPGAPSADALQRILQTMVATLANLPGDLVRPRWQPMPPTQPPPETTWASVGIQKVEADEFPYIVHDGSVRLEGAAGPGASRMQRHSTVTTMITFYGPEAEDAASQMRDALYMPQQMEAMKPFKLLSVRDLARAPEMMNQQWVNRIDVEVELRMQSDRIYPVLNIEAAVVLGDNITVEINP